MRTHFEIVAYPQLNQAFAAYNKNPSTLEELKGAFKIATDAGCTDTVVYNHVDSLLQTMDAVMSDFAGQPTRAEPTSYKIWDLGGQKVCSCML